MNITPVSSYVLMGVCFLTLQQCNTDHDKID